MNLPDADLLSRYRESQAEEAFAEIVRRHLPLVHSAALRQVRSPQLAEEVAQTVFLHLAQNADRLSPTTLLPAWLYAATRNRAIDVVRRESRRQLRERIASELQTMDQPSSPWAEIEPILDDAMQALEETDRTAVLLRYFENRSLREISQCLGTSEDAAQKRVSRAIDRLRALLERHGVRISTPALALALSTQAIQAAPFTLGATLGSLPLLLSANAPHLATLTAATGSPATAGASTASAATALSSSLTMTTKSLVTAGLLAAAIGTGLYQYTRNLRLETETAGIRHALAEAHKNDQLLRDELSTLTKKLAAQTDQTERQARDLAELHRLRSEVARLRSGAGSTPASRGLQSLEETDAQAATSWLARLQRLRGHLQQRPELTVPEFQLLSENDWLMAAVGEMTSDEDLRRAALNLRSTAWNKIAIELSGALQKFMAANEKQFPGAVESLGPFLSDPTHAPLLAGWHVVPAKELGGLILGGDSIITQRQRVDPDLDAAWGIGPHGMGTTQVRGSQRTGTSEVPGK